MGRGRRKILEGGDRARRVKSKSSQDTLGQWGQKKAKMEVYLTEDIPNTCFQNCGTVRVYLRYESSYSTQVVFFAPKSISINWILYKFWDGLVHSLESVLQNCAGTQGPSGRAFIPVFFCMAKLKI